MRAAVVRGGDQGAPEARIRLVRLASARLKPVRAAVSDLPTAALAPGYMLVEAKGDARPASADRMLRLGGCPVSLSKYIIGQPRLTPGLPDNDVHRLDRANFLTGPFPTPVPLLEGNHAA